VARLFRRENDVRFVVTAEYPTKDCEYDNEPVEKIEA
jgi:hypothetical protein